VKAAYGLTMVVAGLMLAQAALGLAFRDYYLDVDWIEATWLGNDWVTLAVALPLLVGGLAWARRGSIRATLLWLGVLGYALYNYAYYLFGAALNVFFPLYLSAVIAAALALILAASSVSPRDLACSFSGKTPVRVIGGYFVFVGVALACVWLTLWAAHVFAGHPTPVEPEAFKIVAALDTVLMVPALAIGGILLTQRNAWGYVISAAAGVQASLYLIVLSTNSIVVVVRGLASPPGEIPLWVSLAGATSAATLLLLSHAGHRVEV
jgi:hypothetical protein